MTTICSRAAALVAAIGAFVPAMAVSGQQATNQASATQPGKGVWVFRERLAYMRFENAPDDGGGTQDVDQFSAESILAYGITGDLAVMAHLPAKVRWFTRGRDSALGDRRDVDGGLADWTLMGQWRFLRVDRVGIDTARYAMQFGVEGPSYNEALSSESFDPFIGMSTTHIVGRHGFGGGVRYKFNTDSVPNPVEIGDGGDGYLTADLSYLYRLSPEAYGSEPEGSTYAQIELNARYEVDGDRQNLVAPGLLYEAPTWAAEISVQVPIDQRTTDTADLRVSVVAGLRVLF
ncbi:MAG: hypothetical protein AAGK09_04710 [Planctomycetota bacterium]